MPRQLPAARSIFYWRHPFVSRAVFGAERTGKTNLVASVMQQLSVQGIKIFVINLSCVDVGQEDTTYWDKPNIRSVRGDLETITDATAAKQLIDKAIALVEEFMQETGSQHSGSG